jgi:CheY-like chemotaxis protein
MKVLIIDDDTNLTEIWKLSLRQHGIDAITASTGKDGLDEAKSQKPDFILIDQIMPDMKGNDVLKILKQNPDTSSIPMAIISNYSDNQLIQEAIQEGAMDYILKYQIEDSDLINKIKNLSEEAKNNHN